MNAQRFDSAYRSGEWDFFADPCELPRYSLLIGYLLQFSAAPAVLDIGCGPGLLRRLLPEAAFSSYAGIDLSGAAIEMAAPLADSRTTFTVGDATACELPAADVVVLNEVLCYPPSPASFLARVGAAVRPGGLVLTSLWRHPGDRELWRLLDNAFRPVAASRVRAERSPYNLRGHRVSVHRAPDRRS